MPGGGDRPAKKPSVTVQPIESLDVAEVAEFLHRNLNTRVSIASWERLMRPKWVLPDGERGFRLLSEGRTVGAYVAVHARRPVGGVETTVCNLAAFCVLPEFRMHSLRLMRTLLSQKETVFTDLSPSGAVPAMNERLGFQHFEVSTRLMANLPAVARRGASVSDDDARIAGALAGVDADLYRDHRDAAAARHLVVRAAGGYAYLVYRRDRRKRMPLFATPLYVGGDAEILRQAWPLVAAHLLRRGLPFTLAEERVLGFTPRGLGRQMAHPRPRMYRGEPAPHDYLYSELALLPW